MEFMKLIMPIQFFRGPGLIPTRLVMLIGAVLVAGCTRSSSSPDRVHSYPSRAMESPETVDISKLQAGMPRIRLRWMTETEENVFGFFVHRADSEDGELECLNEMNPVPAMGDTTTPQLYTYYDLNVDEGKTYYYQVISMDLDSTTQSVFDVDRIPAGPKPLTQENLDDIREYGLQSRKINK
jgi:hypothetical protein